MEGEILAERSYAGDVSKEAVLEALRALEGEVELPVSAYSAIKKDGMPMYKRARKAAAKGEVVIDVPRRVMKVYETELLEIKEIETENCPRLEMKVRTKVGEYRIEDAKRLEEFDTLAQRLLNKLKFW